MDRANSLRRLESLSDTVFGVAMTFLAYRLPLPEPPAPAPRWTDLLLLLGPRLAAFVLGFAVAGLFWLSHHRRLALTAQVGGLELTLNFGFLFLVVILPLATGMLGSYGASPGIAAIYAGYLTVLSALNTLLWVLAIRNLPHGIGQARPWRATAAPVFASVVFAVSTLVAVHHPGWAELLLGTAFLSPLLLALGRRPEAEKPAPAGPADAANLRPAVPRPDATSPSSGPGAP